MITIVKESNGTIEEYSVVDMRTFRTISTHSTIEEARERKEKEIQKLYKGSGVLGNELPCN